MYGRPPASCDDRVGFMPDEETRALSKRMHYAAWRASTAPSRREAMRMRRRYDECRNCIVLGNRKLAHRAVHKWGLASQLADDTTSECQIVLIKAAAAFNPWLGIRFSTYAFTCLMRALSRISQRHAADRLNRALPLESLRYGEPCYAVPEEPATPSVKLLHKFLEKEHTLLSPREKFVLTRRYNLNDDHASAVTLEQVGRELGLSKERVRQMQKSALGKLGNALLLHKPRSSAIE